MTHEERGGMPQHLGTLARNVLPQSGSLDTLMVPDAATRTIRLVRVDHGGTNAPTSDKGYRCLDCRDTGAVPYTVLAPFRDQEIPYSYVCRCECPRGFHLPHWIPTFYQLFGTRPPVPGGDSAALPEGGKARWGREPSPPPPPAPLLLDSPQEARAVAATTVFDLTALLGEDDD